jgi:hypothetical protein
LNPEKTNQGLHQLGLFNPPKNTWLELYGVDATSIFNKNKLQRKFNLNGLINCLLSE